jgi:hypothetical protein
MRKCLGVPNSACFVRAGLAPLAVDANLTVFFALATFDGADITARGRQPLNRATVPCSRAAKHKKEGVTFDLSSGLMLA